MMVITSDNKAISLDMVPDSNQDWVYMVWLKDKDSITRLVLGVADSWEGTKYIQEQALLKYNWINCEFITEKLKLNTLAY